jgi:hypothetical protein
MTRLSERLLRQQKIALDTASLKTALRQLRQVLEKNSHPTKLYAESLARRNIIAVATLDRGDDGAATIVVKPARELSMFLRQAERERKKRDAA